MLLLPCVLLQEDEVLRKRIKSYGLNNWGMVADGLPGRSGKSCSERCVPDPPDACWGLQQQCVSVAVLQPGSAAQ